MPIQTKEIVADSDEYKAAVKSKFARFGPSEDPSRPGKILTGIVRTKLETVKGPDGEPLPAANGEGVQKVPVVQTNSAGEPFVDPVKVIWPDTEDEAAEE